MSIPFAAIVSRNIRMETARVGWSYAELARITDMNRSAVGYRWRDERQWTLSEIEVVAQALGVTPLGLCRAEGVLPSERTNAAPRVATSEAFKVHRRRRTASH